MKKRKLIHKVVGRLASMGAFNKLNDKNYIQLVFWARMGEKLSLENPKTFNEKLQWLKLYDRNPEYTMMVDKYEAKQYVSNLIGEEYIIPTLGIWEKFEDIDFNELPNQFVLKCTHDSGGLIICRDKSKLDKKAAKRKINKAINTNFYLHGREWPYKDVKPRIIAECYMEDAKTNELRDYKFYCFNGKVNYIYISRGLENHATANISFFKPNGEPAPFRRSDYFPFEKIPQMPKNFEKMKKIAENLSNKFIFLRVDLYEVNNKIYFSELTFSPCGGFMPFEPPQYDRIVGEHLQLW